MRLTKLELQGFKSFAKKTELVFGDGITAIIGPNGSGKSNISDAVRWVLGEQSARALRGGKMEDVIFGGTQKRRPLSMGEVILTFDNSDHRLPLDYNEVAVTRRVYRSGDSEYAINGKGCRLKDILELFRDTGIGKDGYSIIGQGKVDEILSNKSADRREALEEAAGVMRYRVRREEAERKLELTKKNMERLGDILSELSGRLGPLKEQSEKAVAYKDIKASLKELEINLFLSSTEKGREHVKAQEAALALIQQSLDQDEKEDALLQQSCRELEDRIRALEEQLDAGQKRLLALLSQAEAKQGEKKVIEERLLNFDREKQRLQEQGAAALEKVKAIELESEKLKQAAGADTEELKKRIGRESLALSEAERRCSEAEEALEEKKNRIMESMNRLSDTKSSLTRLETMSGALQQRDGAIDGELEAARERQKAFALELQEAKEELNAFCAAENGNEAALKNARDNRASLETEYAQAQQTLRALEQESGALSSKLHVLEEMARRREGYQNSVKLIMEAAEKDDSLRRCILGVVAEAVRVPEELETAVGVALGGAAQNLIAPTGRDAKTIIETLRRRDFGRATVLPLDLLSDNSIRERDRQFLKEPGVLGVASELIEYDGAVEKAVRYLLGRTVVVEDLNCGLSLKEKAKGAFQIVTLKGDSISAGGAMTGGSQQKRSFGFLGRQREIEELKNAYTAKETERKKEEKAVQKQKDGLLQASLQTDAFVKALHESELKAQKQRDKVSIIERDGESCGESLQALLEEKQDNLENLASLKKRMESITGEKQSLEKDDALSREEIVALQKALLTLRRETEEQRAAVTELRLSLTAAEKEADARDKESSRLLAQRQEMLLENRRCGAEADDLTARVEEEKKNASLLSGLMEIYKQQSSELHEEQQRIEDSRTALKEELSCRREKRDQLLSAQRELLDRRTRAEMALGKTQTSLEQQQDKIWQSYQLTYENALLLRTDAPLTGAVSQAGELRESLRRLGDVNLSSIEEYQEVAARHQGLSEQYKDLDKAAEDLYALIEKLTRTMESVFTGEFNRVQEQFKTVFTELFGGGQAELRLSDPKDVLNCDIDIIAQPPGKKLQLLSLMSGGERALTAIALLFAMLRVKSPAFCVLDEIETSLDEANVNRFADFLRAYSHETQFILITHRKGSMEACNTLYGVAMEEKGVSSIVSAKFEEVS